MDFARRQRDPTRHLVGITFVVLLHVLVIYGLMTGLARKAVEVIKKPVTATIIEEIKKPPPPPPPPPKKIEPPPKAPPPPRQTYVPPPDIPVPPPAITAPTITQVTPTVPVTPYVIEPPPPPKVEAPPAPPPPKPAGPRNLTYARIGGEDVEYPRAAMRANVQKGRVVARLMIDENGNVTDVQIISADPPRVFNQEVIEKVKTWKFKPEGQQYSGTVEVNFSLKD